ncbi:DNA N-6-adenine-methyltransferase [Candidatus Enterococcus ikei]|uniref:Phage N-6-adenine-methyltransferase n=1 Tax=Candidatus Enterococcus ikei TaxID=2815326 RepID=A0ABS3H1U4_9ENTE|nr:DNA N-6-adenine-methyltransferase [Enterococcus sp. DIV0869a]MBO0441497.1 phage N-6-adenine-methyltransferase [Enterococcus sp. DIV0869a]
MNTEILFSSKKQDWETPQYLYEQLDSQYHFDLDAAASHSNAKAPKYFTEEDDALQQDWGLYNSIFCNPPYSTKMQNEFVKKAYETYKKHNNTIVLLIPARTGTWRWHKYIFGKARIDFLEGRLHFETNGNRHKINAPFDSAIVVYGDLNNK